MNVEEFRAYCLSKKGTSEGFPFDEVTLVFKVMGKIFTFCPLERSPAQVSLKCNPERAIELREEYDGLIYGAYHLNKAHWNTVELEKDIPLNLIKELIDHSYDLVVQGLTKKLKNELAEL